VFGLADPTLNIFAPQGLTRFDPTDQDQVNWSGEISLDVEWAHAIAPRATIDLVLARTPADLDTTVQWVADHGGGDVVSLSWGSDDRCPASRSPHVEFAQLTRNGTTVFASAGDTGAAEHSCDGSTWVRAAGSPASDPNVTAVGGTDLRANGITGAYRSETVWNEGTDAVGGSGLSAVYREPAFQRGVQSTGWRSVPDVSYHAATRNGVLIAWSEGGGHRFQSFGGTSSGCPQWAATVALADQLAGHRLGNINPWLYHLAATVGQSALFHDVTRGNTSVTEVDANNNPVSIPGDSAGKGWDFATGFGSPRADVLVPLLARGA
jgi:subtilase family serine protease